MEYKVEPAGVNDWSSSEIAVDNSGGTSQRPLVLVPYTTVQGKTLHTGVAADDLGDPPFLRGVSALLPPDSLSRD